MEEKYSVKLSEMLQEAEQDIKIDFLKLFVQKKAEEAGVIIIADISTIPTV